MIKRKIVEEISEYDEKGILVRTTTTTTTEEDDSATSGYAHISIPSDGSWKVGPDDPPWEATTSVSCGGGDTAAADTKPEGTLLFSAGYAGKDLRSFPVYGHSL